MSDSFKTEEEFLLWKLKVLEREYEKSTKPYFDRLFEIHARKQSEYVISDVNNPNAIFTIDNQQPNADRATNETPS